MYATAALDRKFLLQPSSSLCTPSGSRFQCFTWWHLEEVEVPGFSFRLEIMMIYICTFHYSVSGDPRCLMRYCDSTKPFLFSFHVTGA